MLSQTAVFHHRVRDHMQAAFVSITPSTRCEDVVRRMREHPASAAVIEDGGGRLAGIVTEQDVCRRMAFNSEPHTPVEAVMTTQVRSVRDDAYLYRAIAHMQRCKLRHMPVVDAGGRVVGILYLTRALEIAAHQMVGHIQSLTHEATLDGMKGTKGAQVAVAAELFRDTVPAPEIQALLTRINNDLCRRIVERCMAEMADEGMGGPPVPFDVIVMGSGGRGESFLNPDQDNGFVLADYPDDQHDTVDAWFIELAERMTRALDQVGFDYCRGNVMASNPLWRKTLSQWRQQLSFWVGKGDRHLLRMSDIFFDFTAVYGDGAMTAALREHVTEISARPFFLREMYKNDEEHGVALGFFGNLQTDPRPGSNQGKVNLKLTGTLPLVGGVRVIALREKIPQTSTLLRIRALHEKGILNDDEDDYLRGAYRHITNLLLRQQLDDFRAGRPVGNHVPPEAMSKREKDMLVDCFKAIRSFRSRLRLELIGDIF